MTKQSFLKQVEDEEYKPTRPAKAASRKKKAQQPQNEMKNSSKWTLDENRRFLEFVRSNKEMLECPLKRKEQRVFLQLSRFIVTRTPDQCRSHHQKMIKHHNDLQGIIENLQKRLSNSLNLKEMQSEGNSSDEMLQKKEKVEESLFFQTKIDIEIESVQSKQNDLWSILNEQIWIEKPIDMLGDF